jgi:hypothetical protein
LENEGSQKVTIAIGLIHKFKTQNHPQGGFQRLPAIWMASDSQTTHASTKRENPNKINIIDFENGQILVAQSDSVEIGDRVIEILKKKANGKMMVDADTAINTVREALVEVRSALLEINKGQSIDLEKFFWTENRLNLLIGYYFNEQPYLYKIEICRAIPTWIKSFESIGGGEILGYFLIKEYAKADPDFEYGLPIAVSVVDKVIENVDGCGSPTWVGHVFPVPDKMMVHGPSGVSTKYQCFCGMLPQSETELLSQELKKSNARSATLGKGEIIKLMKRLNRKHARQFIKERTSHDRFLRLRYSPALSEAVKSSTKYIDSIGNKESRRMIRAFSKELGNVNNKEALKALWNKICELCPEISQRPELIAEIAKLF